MSDPDHGARLKHNDQHSGVAPVKNVTDNGAAVEVTYDTPAGEEITDSFDTAIIATTAQPALRMYPQMDENRRCRHGAEGHSCRVASLFRLPFHRAMFDAAGYPDDVTAFDTATASPSRAISERFVLDF